MLVLPILDERLKARFSVTDQLVKQGAHRRHRLALLRSTARQCVSANARKLDERPVAFGFVARRQRGAGAAEFRRRPELEPRRRPVETTAAR